MGNEEISVGNGEIQVLGDNDTVYVAPTMILHYIMEHRYRPPQLFVDAVAAGRLPALPPSAYE